MLHVLRLQLSAKARRIVQDCRFVAAHSSRCYRSHAHTTCIRPIVASTPALSLLRSPVLKPYFHLSVGQSDRPGELGLALDRDVLAEEKFFLELDFLMFRVYDAVLVLGPCLVTCTQVKQ